jgi:uncharacterized protein (UPF0218 family)
LGVEDSVNNAVNVSKARGRCRSLTRPQSGPREGTSHSRNPPGSIACLVAISEAIVEEELVYTEVTGVVDLSSAPVREVGEDVGKVEASHGELGDDYLGE